MKKIFVVSTFNDQKLKESSLKDAQIIAYRQDYYGSLGEEKTLFYQNLEFYKGNGKIEFNPTSSTVTLSFKIKNGEFLAIGSEPGMAEKNKILKKIR